MIGGGLAPDDVGVCGEMERRGEGGAAFMLGGAELVCQCERGLWGPSMRFFVAIGGEDERGLSG
jgi:hypothetical protein